MGVSLRILGRYKEAIQASSSAIRVNANDVSAYTNIGECYLLLKDNQEAIRALERAVEIDPKSATAHLHLGRCYLNESIQQLSARRKVEGSLSLRKAKDHFQRAVDLDPDGKTGRDAQKTLEILGR
jgi:tetratricopeptide (TPR) repeat protein